MKFVPSLLLLFLASVGLAAPPDVPPDVAAPQDKVREIVVKVPDGKTLLYRAVGDRVAFREMKSSAKGESVFWLISETGGRSHVVWWFQGEDESAVTDVNKTVVPPGPTPPGPNPPPGPDPKPVPVTSFRVFLIFESGQTGTPGQAGALGAKSIEEWLTANCTGGRQGWDRRDKDSNDDVTGLKDVWKATKPAVTSTPCIAIEVNGKITIEPITNTANTLTLLKSYKEGK